MARRGWGCLATVAAVAVVTAGWNSTARATTAPAESTSITTTSCVDAATHLAATRTRRVNSAKAATQLAYVDLATLVPRNPPAADWGDEYLGGPPIGITSLPAGAVSEARATLVPNGVEEGFVRGFNSGREQTRVFYAVYRFATTAGAMNVADAVIKSACQRKQDLISSESGIVGASSIGTVGGGLDMVLVRNRLLFDFYADGEGVTLDRVQPLASAFFAQADSVSPGSIDAATIGRATTSRACGRLFLMLSGASVDSPTFGELRTTAKDSLAAIKKGSADPDARKVATTLRKFVRSIRRRSSAFFPSDASTERAAAFDNACRQLTGRGVFRN